MGSPKGEVGRGDNEIPHEVSFAHGFWMADTACTQEVWKAVTGKNPSNFKNKEDSIQELPVETVSVDDVQAFLTQLNERIGKEATFSLPTEAQWEYACRAGTNTPTSFGKSISTDQAHFKVGLPYPGNVKGEYRRGTVAVK